MFYRNILKTVQGWCLLKTKHALIYWKRPLFQVLTCLYSRIYSNSKIFIGFLFKGVYCIPLKQPSVVFWSDFIISINPLDILVLLMYDNFPIQKMNKLRTSQPQKKKKKDENFMSVWKYLPVKTRIIQKPNWINFIFRCILPQNVVKWLVNILCSTFFNWN